MSEKILKTRAVASQRFDRNDYQGVVNQDVQKDTGWNGAGVYSRELWRCRHSHSTIADAAACAKAKREKLGL